MIMSTKLLFSAWLKISNLKKLISVIDFESEKDRKWRHINYLWFNPYGIEKCESNL